MPFPAAEPPNRFLSIAVPFPSLLHFPHYQEEPSRTSDRMSLLSSAFSSAAASRYARAASARGAHGSSRAAASNVGRGPAGAFKWGGGLLALVALGVRCPSGLR